MEPKKIKIECPSPRQVAQKPGGVQEMEKRTWRSVIKTLKVYNCFLSQAQLL